MYRTSAFGRVGLAIAVAGLLGMGSVGSVAGAPAAVADGEDLDLRVTPEGVGFDGREVSGDVWLQYTVRPPNGDDTRGFGHRVSRAEQRAGWVSFQEAAAAFPGGYCVAWLQLENTQWGSWHQQKQVCRLPETTAGENDDTEPESAPEEKLESESGPQSSADPEKESPQDRPEEESSPAASAKPSESPEPEPSPSEPSTTPSPTPFVTPTPSPSTGAAAAGDAGQSSLESFARPEASGEYERPNTVDLTWLWVVLGGFAAAAGGVVITVMRRPL